MAKPPSSRARAVREPVQVYLAPDDRDLLRRLADETGLSKAEILRQGLRTLARERGDTSPMLKFAESGDASGWPSAAAEHHDALLADEYAGTRRRRK